MTQKNTTSYSTKDLLRQMEAKSFYLKEIEIMKERGADGIILGCTELPILLKDMKAELPLLSTTNLRAKMAVDFILS